MKVCALYDLRLTADQFWELTAREFDLIYERHQNALRHRDLMLAQIAAATINFSMRAPENSVDVRDLTPRMPGERRRRRTQRGPSKKLLSIVAAANLAIQARVAALKAKNREASHAGDRPQLVGHRPDPV